MGKEFSVGDLMRRTGDVLEDAGRAPVTITKRSKPKYILMSVERYDQIMNHSPQRAYRIEELPDDLRSTLINALEHDLARTEGEDDETNGR